MRSNDWIPRPKTPPDRQTCRAKLLLKYIARHGPVSKEDVMYWAYLSKRQLDEALSSISNDLVEVRMGHSKEPYIVLDQDIEQEFPPPPKVILLPKYDSLLLCLKDKSRFMDMAYYKRIFPELPVGMVKPTVLVDGFVAATWRRARKRTATLIEVQPFKKLSTGDKKAIEQQFMEYCEYAGLTPSVRWMRSA